MPKAPEAHEKKGFALFGKKKEVEAGQSPSDLLAQVNGVARRLRVLESRYSDLNRKSQVTEKNMLQGRKRVTKEIKTLDDDILELKRIINQIREKIDTVIFELKNFASKEDFEALRKYIEMWEPLHFVTRDEVEKIVKESVKKNK